MHLGMGLGRIPTGLLPYSSRDTQGTRTYPGQTPYDCVISADYRTRIGRAPEGDRTISDDDRPMSLRHPIRLFFTSSLRLVTFGICILVVLSDCLQKECTGCSPDDH